MSETLKSKDRRLREGFFKNYINGEGIDIGCGRLYGYSDNIRVHETAIAHDKDMCDAHTMNIFEDNRFDYVYSSHVLEHLEDPFLAIKNWYRICKPNGYIIITVPSKYRYEKKDNLPSNWNADHKRFYTFFSFSYEIENSLVPNSYTIEYMKDCYEGYDWSIPNNQHSVGEFQIECVLRKK